MRTCKCNVPCFVYNNVSSGETISKCGSLIYNLTNKPNANWEKLEFTRNNKELCDFKSIIHYKKPRKYTPKIQKEPSNNLLDFDFNRSFMKRDKKDNPREDIEDLSKLIKIFKIHRRIDMSHIIKEKCNRLKWPSKQFNIYKGFNSLGQRMVLFDWMSYIDEMEHYCNISISIAKVIGYKDKYKIRTDAIHKNKKFDITDDFKGVVKDRYYTQLSPERREHMKRLRQRMRYMARR